MQFSRGFLDAKRPFTAVKPPRCHIITHASPHSPSSAPSTNIAPEPLPSSSKQDLEDFQHVVKASEFRRLGYEVIDWMADYMERGLEQQKRVRPDLKPGYLQGALPSAAPEKPEPWSAVMQDFKDKIMPGVVHWQSPRFFAYFAANTSAPATLADMLAGALNMIGFSWAASPVSTELEMAMMDWLGQLVGLPQRFLFSTGGAGGGVIQGTSSEAVLVALLGARARAMRGRPAADKLKLVAYASDQTHSCFKKACMVLALDHVRVLPTSSADGFALRPETLQAAMRADVEAGLVPCYVCATIGTTSSCAVDPVEGLAEVAQRYGAWVHVDAAYAGSAAVCQEQRQQHFGGLDKVDSYSFNPHKWLLTNFDCCAMWMGDTGPVREALSLTPVFLRGAGNDLDFKDLQLPLGRKFRSLKMYFVMRMYGAEKLRQYIRHHIAIATWFAEQVAADPRFELAATPRFGLVCFRLKGASREANVALLDQIHASGELALTQTELEGRYTIRLAVGAASSQLRHVQQAWEAIQQAADEVLAGNGS